jgi:hypothetical protein
MGFERVFLLFTSSLTHKRAKYLPLYVSVQKHFALFENIF